MRRARSPVVLALAVVGLLATAVAAQAPPRPVLVVVLVVDQLRADYIDRFGHQWTQGLRRLVDEGAWFRRARFPYFNTVTCAGHATVATGSLPSTHGLLMNAWYDRDTGRLVGCTADPGEPTIGYDGARSGGHSARALRVPTLSDEMRAQLPRAPRVVAMSLKARSAVTLAGHEADTVVWFEGRSLATSEAYASGPDPFIERFLDEHPIGRDLGAVWDRVLPLDAYLYPPTSPGSDSEAGWDDALPHTLGSGIEPDAAYYRGWSRSPFADRYLVDLAIAAVDEHELGRRGTTDYLALGLSALDRVGHDFGPRSHELQDTLVRLDAALGDLMDHLDGRVGASRYVVALTSDHGVMPIPEQLQAMGVDAGRLDVEEVAARAEAAADAALGPGDHVARINHTELYFQPGVYDQLARRPSALQAVMAAVSSVPGVGGVYRTEEVPALRASPRGFERALALSHVPDRSGDLLVVPKIYWTTAENATGHGTGYAYDAGVPVVLSGHGIRPGRYDTDATPADIAPTLAHLIGITLPRPDGRVLSEALEAIGAGWPRVRPTTEGPP